MTHSRLARPEYYRAGGVALGRFLLADGRRPDEEWMARAMVAHFVPGTVPLLTGHGGTAVGYLDALRADGPDLRFSATCSGYPEVQAKLRRGHPVSIEVVDWRRPPVGGWPPGRVHRGGGYPVSPFFRGRVVEEGPHLVAVALVSATERPAARGSVAWLEPE